MKLNNVVRFLSVLTIALAVRANVLYASEDAIERVVRSVVHIGVVNEPDTHITTVGGGVIITRNGYVLTAKHNLMRADHLYVKTVDGKAYPVIYYVADAHRDLAILRVDTGRDKLPAAKLGDDKALRVGQTVFTIGYPVPLFVNDDDPTVARGIVSALNRVLTVSPTSGDILPEEMEMIVGWELEYTDIPASSDGSLDVERTPRIQIDAMVNHGSSGGPLVNENGEVVGIVQSMVTDTGSNVGMNFAIPVSEAKILIAIAGIKDGK